jgi:hypothetical protein
MEGSNWSVYSSVTPDLVAPEAPESMSKSKKSGWKEDLERHDYHALQLREGTALFFINACHPGHVQASWVLFLPTHLLECPPPHCSGLTAGGWTATAAPRRC